MHLPDHLSLESLQIATNKSRQSDADYQTTMSALAGRKQEQEATIPVSKGRGKGGFRLCGLT